MKRSGGVTASAVVTIIGSLVFLLFAAVFFAARTFRPGQPGMPPFMRASLLLCGFLMLVLAAGGITTAIGLFRLRAWSRISVLVFSGFLTIIFGLSAAMILLVPFPQPVNAPPAPAGLRVGIAFFYGLFALLGGGWLYFFNREGVKGQFPSSGNSRPLSVSIIAGFFLFSGAVVIILGALPMPANFFGLVVGGVFGHLLYVAYAAVALWSGAGLLGLKPLARKVAIGFCVFYALNNVLFVALPGYTQRMLTFLAFLPPEVRAAQSSDYARTMVVWLLVGALMYLVPIWFLVIRRGAFSASEETAQKLL